VKYYIYFDRYRHPRRAVSEDELAQNYENSPEKFLRAMCNLSPDSEIEHSIGHVGVMRFSGEKELKDYLEMTGDEIAGFLNAKEKAAHIIFESPADGGLSTSRPNHAESESQIL
jgi:hypothetical protein